MLQHDLLRNNSVYMVGSRRMRIQRKKPLPIKKSTPKNYVENLVLPLLFVFLVCSSPCWVAQWSREQTDLYHGGPCKTAPNGLTKNRYLNNIIDTGYVTINKVNLAAANALVSVTPEHLQLQGWPSFDWDLVGLIVEVFCGKQYIPAWPFLKSRIGHK